MKASDFMVRNPLTVHSDDSLHLAGQLMLWAGVRHLPVVEGDHVVGILSERELTAVSASEGSRAAVATAMKRPVHTCGPDDSLAEITGRLAGEHIDCLPVTQRGKLIGIVTTTDVLTAQLGQQMVPERGDREIGEVMTRDPIAVHEDDSLVDAASLMTSRGIRHLPVIDGEQKILGLLEEADVRVAIAAAQVRGKGEEKNLRVADVMDESPVVLETDLLCGDAAKLFAGVRQGAFLVADNDRLAGILSYVDVLRGLTE